MRLEKFLKEAVSMNIEISNRAEYDWDWHVYNQYAGLTGLVDFECDFENGVCKVYRRERMGRTTTNRPIMCCCGGCRSTIGHHKRLPNYMRKLKAIAYLFDEKTGFWRKDKGCILPREDRSITCLFYRCETQFGEEHPFYLLEKAMKTFWKRDRYDNIVIPKAAINYGDKKVAWPKLEVLKRALKAQVRKDNRKKEKESK